MAREKRTGPSNTHDGREYRLLCRDCDRETTHKTLHSVEYRTEYEDERYDVTSWDDYQIVECQGCRDISFRHSHRDSENVDYDPKTEQGFLIETQRLYPPREQGRTPLADAYLLPNQIRTVYEETLAARHANLAVLTGVGLRAIVETVCKERGAAGRNLKEQIDGLVVQHVLTPDGAKILHSLRIMGNEAAHDVKPHSPSVLDTAFEVIEYVLSGVYILPERAKELPT